MLVVKNGTSNPVILLYLLLPLFLVGKRSF